jgi:hypothetical protein
MSCCCASEPAAATSTAAMFSGSGRFVLGAQRRLRIPLRGRPTQVGDMHFTESNDIAEAVSKAALKRSTRRTTVDGYMLDAAVSGGTQT